MLSSGSGPACGRRAHLIDVLWIPGNAKAQQQVASDSDVVMNGRYLRGDGSVSVSFEVITDRQRLIEDVVAHFYKLGWRRRVTQYLNPQLPTSFAAGWQHRCGCVLQLDEQGRPIHRERFAWDGEWENERGDIAKYSLSAESDHVSGYAFVNPARNIRASLAMRAREPAR
jgi:hypothetical protein